MTASYARRFGGDGPTDLMAALSAVREPAAPDRLFEKAITAPSLDAIRARAGI